MSDRLASFLICDDVLVALNGKFFIQGVYTGDIVISGEEQKLGQLIVFLQIITPNQKPFRLLELHLSLPGEEHPRMINLMPLLPAVLPVPGRNTLSYKIPVQIVFPTLRAGPMEVTILHDEGELLVGRQWVTAQVQAQELQRQMDVMLSAKRN